MTKTNKVSIRGKVGILPCYVIFSVTFYDQVLSITNTTRSKTLLLQEIDLLDVQSSTIDFRPRSVSSQTFLTYNFLKYELMFAEITASKHK